VLVDQQNNVIGTAPKETVHTHVTPLHRGFSCFVFNDKKEVLITKRSERKKTFPGVWTNTVCGHPAEGESVVAAARRRMQDELGLVIQDLREVSPYQYRFEDRNGIVENEI
jgi:isopentenyl-diphosphate delta-isomerase